MSICNRYRRYISTRTISLQGRTVQSLLVRRAVEYKAYRSVCVLARGLLVQVAVQCQRRVKVRMQIGAESYYTSLEPQRPSLPIASSSCSYPVGVERHTPRLVAYRPARYRKGIQIQYYGSGHKLEYNILNRVVIEEGYIRVTMRG